MKKLVLLLSFTTAILINTNAQPTKADVDKILGVFSFSGMNKIVIKNIRLFNTDGSIKSQQQTDFDAIRCSLEVTETGIHVQLYKDETKAEPLYIIFYPYSSIEALEASSKTFTIALLK